MGEGHNIKEHEGPSMDEAIKFIKEDVFMQALIEAQTTRFGEVLNDKLYTWDSNQKRLDKTENRIFGLFIFCLFLLAGLILLYIEYINHNNGNLFK